MNDIGHLSLESEVLPRFPQLELGWRVSFESHICTWMHAIMSPNRFAFYPIHKQGTANGGANVKEGRSPLPSLAASC